MITISLYLKAINLYSTDDKIDFLRFNNIDIKHPCHFCSKSMECRYKNPQRYFQC